MYVLGDQVLRLRGLFVGFEAGCQLADALTAHYFPHLQVRPHISTLH